MNQPFDLQIILRKELEELIMKNLETLVELVNDRSNCKNQNFSNLGYFCVPFRPQTGPFSEKVIKIYRHINDNKVLEKLVQNHSEYIRKLQEKGINVPETEIHIINLEKRQVPVIVQEAIDPKNLMRDQIINSKLNQTIYLLEIAAKVIANFWNNLGPEDGRVGFHPSIRNFAIEDDKAIFFDSFPPLINYSHKEIGALLTAFSENTLIRIFGPLLQPKISMVQNEWYSASETFVGLVGSACRLKPSYAPEILKWGRNFARYEMQKWDTEIMSALESPPKLPGYWTAFRKLLNLPGKPNI